MHESNLLEQFMVFNSTWDGAGTYVGCSFFPLSVTAASSSHSLFTQRARNARDTMGDSYFGIHFISVITQ